MSSRIEYDVVLVGGSPGNFALAHRLVDLAKENNQPLKMAVLEKSKEFGGHVISGAVSNPHVINKLFPNHKEEGFPIEAVCDQSYFSVLGNKGKWDVPKLLQPPGLHKEGYYVLTLSHVVYWMYNKLKEKLAGQTAIEVDFYPGFAAHSVIFEGDKVAGVRVTEHETGHDDDNNVYAKVTVFGDKGFTSRDVMKQFGLRDETNVQIWSVGVKEVWQLADDKDFAGKVWHTMGFPLVDGSFGGSFVYGMKDKKLTIGLIASLDSPNPNINPQQRLQDLKKHPWIQKMIDGGKLLKYGAAILPEGGYYSLPKQFQVNGALFTGDALGVLDIATLSGIDNAMESGYQAAEVIHEAFKKNDFSQAGLGDYQKRVMDSFVGKKLWSGRYFRQAWQENPRLLNEYLPKVMDGIDSGVLPSGFLAIGLKNPAQSIGDALRLKTLMEGNKDIGPVRYKEDYKHIVPDFKVPRTITTNGYNKETVYSRADAVFYAHTHYHEENRHIDEFRADTCVQCIGRYDKAGKEVPCVSDCTAEVHRVDIVDDLRRHGMSLENCVQCRTCEIVCPEVNLRVRPAAEASGPDFMGL